MNERQRQVLLTLELEDAAMLLILLQREVRAGTLANPAVLLGLLEALSLSLADVARLSRGSVAV